MKDETAQRLLFALLIIATACIVALTISGLQFWWDTRP